MNKNEAKKAIEKLEILASEIEKGFSKSKKGEMVPFKKDQVPLTRGGGI